MLGRWLKIVVSFCVIVALATMVVDAQQTQDLGVANQVTCNGQSIDIKIYFEYDESHIDLTYMENQQSLYLVDSLLINSAYVSTLRRIDITAQSSPEGSIEHNEQLSEQRRASLEEYFTTNYPHIEPSLWSFNAVAENWDLFHQHLVEDANLPNRDEILSISQSDREPDDKEWLLKKMDDGKPWQYIKEHILPTQRFGASVLFIPIAETLATPLVEEATVASAVEPEVVVVPQETPQCVESEEVGPKVLFALKTNLLLDVASIINIGLEVPLGDKFSFVGEVTYPWWRSWPNNFTMQIESYHGELKYWLGQRSRENRLTGWSVGMYGGWGLYDIQLFSEEGVQGDFFDVGVHVGYSHSIAKNLHLEYMLGVGYISTKYNDYYMAYDTEQYNDIKVIAYPWMNSKLSTVLPTRVGVSLVWLINSKGEGGGR